ncbi:hypothetical protein PC116_g14144 [Phytophthora cactorum]|nr:hypothetical protein PC116_g14144 [Phytophthora cactorum]
MTEEITSPSQKVRFRTILKSSRHLLDMALVNVLIVHRYSNRVNGQKPTKHYAFFETLMEQLLAVDAAAFKDIENVTSTEDHKADTENGKKSRHMTCKCHRKYLCNVVREGR